MVKLDLPCIRVPNDVKILIENITIKREKNIVCNTVGYMVPRIDVNIYLLREIWTKYVYIVKINLLIL